MKPKVSPLLLCLLGGLAAAASAEESSQRPKLEIALDGERLGIELKSPAQNIVGFEHEPFTVSERNAAAQAATSLQSGQELFALPEEAECRAAATVLETPDWERLRREQRNRDEVARDVFQDPNVEAQRVAARMDYRARYRFDCKHPEKLDWVDVQLLDRLKGSSRLDTHVVTPTAQATHTVTKDSLRVPLK